MGHRARVNDGAGPRGEEDALTLLVDGQLLPVAFVQETLGLGLEGGGLGVELAQGFVTDHLPVVLQQLV